MNPLINKFLRSFGVLALSGCIGYGAIQDIFVNPVYAAYGDQEVSLGRSSITLRNGGGVFDYAGNFYYNYPNVQDSQLLRFEALYNADSGRCELTFFSVTYHWNGKLNLAIRFTSFSEWTAVENNSQFSLSSQYSFSSVVATMSGSTPSKNPTITFDWTLTPSASYIERSESARYESGVSEAYSNGYSNGYANGYNVGASEDWNENGLGNLFNNILEAPVTIIRDSLNFEIFGINLWSLASVALTGALVFVVVKVLTKGGE